MGVQDRPLSILIRVLPGRLLSLLVFFSSSLSFHLHPLPFFPSLPLPFLSCSSPIPLSLPSFASFFRFHFLLRSLLIPFLSFLLSLTHNTSDCGRHDTGPVRHAGPSGHLSPLCLCGQLSWWHAGFFISSLLPFLLFSFRFFFFFRFSFLLIYADILLFLYL